LSRHEILESNNHRLPDGSEPRTALDARVRLPNGEEVVICGVHFYQTKEQRLAQAKTVVDIYKDVQTPVIIGGDFNSKPGSPVVTLFEQRWVNPDKGDDCLTIPSDDPRSEIDFVMYRPADRFEVVSIDVIDEPVISDHRPVLLVLRTK
ncbi:unnamed protein product, partial [Discosporangium mesarthrocarpum]